MALTHADRSPWPSVAWVREGAHNRESLSCAVPLQGGSGEPRKWPSSFKMATVSRGSQAGSGKAYIR